MRNNNEMFLNYGGELDPWMQLLIPVIDTDFMIQVKFRKRGSEGYLSARSLDVRVVNMLREDVTKRFEVEHESNDIADYLCRLILEIQGEEALKEMCGALKERLKLEEEL